MHGYLAGKDANCRPKILDTYVICAYNHNVHYQWDPYKNALNQKKHGIDFADTVGVFEDESALWQEDTDDEYIEERFIALGADFLGRTLVVIFTFRGEAIRIISARKATENERKTYESQR